MKEVSIRPLTLAKRKNIAEHRAKRRLFKGSRKISKAIRQAQKQSVVPGSDFDVDPIEFAHAFASFRKDIEALLSPAEQGRFCTILRGYLNGHVSHEVWRSILGALNSIRRASAPPEPHGYWKQYD